MLFYPFKNYEEFKELFGIEAHGNGTKSRRNKILLQWLKQKWVISGAVRGDFLANCAIGYRSLISVWEMCANRLCYASNGCYTISVGDFMTLHSNKYSLDEYKGVCMDGDPRAIRYINSENGRVFKMRAGKFLKAVALECEFGRKLSEPVMLWLCEEFTRRWETYTAGKVAAYKLVVNDDFYDIYDGHGRCRGDFHSCMRGGYHADFYDNAVKAKAASLRDAEGYIVARCVIFTEVRDDETGEIVRLAERQYSTEGDELLKRLLIDELIKGGYIDGYKRVGADCGSARSFVSNDGADWSDREFSIKCNLEPGDVLSYQDSFKWYDMDCYRADNYNYGEYELDSTDDYFEEGGNYDSWHEEYTTNDIERVFYHGREYWCDEERMGDFIWVDAGSGRDEYHHKDDVTHCEYEDIWVLNEDADYSSILEDYFYDTDTMHQQEEEYKADNWYWSEYDEEYFENEEDVVKMHFANGEVMTISVESAECNFEFEIDDNGIYHELVEEEVYETA